MLSPLLAIGIGAALSDAVAVRSGCQFHLTVGGAITGPVGQISSGQVRAGKGISSGTFSIQGDEIWDSQGRGCWWTPPTHVLQCDKNQNPDNGFKIGCDGSVSYKGQTEFYECQADTNGQYGIYLMPSGVKCNKVTLKADGCHAKCQPPPPPPPPPSTCPTNLNGPYEFPHLIVPVNSANPDKAYGTSYNGEISSTISTIFNFDIPSSDKGKKCSLVFLFPKQQDLQTSSFTFSGDGKLDFEWLKSPATKSTTYHNQPGVSKDLGVQTVSPGHSYNVATFACPAGQTVGFEIKAAGNTHLKYFQDYNPSPIGLYITKC